MKRETIPHLVERKRNTVVGKAPKAPVDWWGVAALVLCCGSALAVLVVGLVVVIGGAK